MASKQVSPPAPVAERAAANGQAPAPAEDCADCASGGEKALAVLGLLAAIGIGLMAIDLLTGGGVSRLVGRAEEVTGDGDGD